MYSVNSELRVFVRDTLFKIVVIWNESKLVVFSLFLDIAEGCFIGN